MQPLFIFFFFAKVQNYRIIKHLCTDFTVQMILSFGLCLPLRYLQNGICTKWKEQKEKKKRKINSLSKSRKHKIQITSMFEHR